MEIFSEDVECDSDSWANVGAGPGAAFQRLTKRCPAFAVEYAAVAPRNTRSHWGPIKRRTAKVRADSEALFRDVQNHIDANGIEEI